MNFCSLILCWFPKMITDLWDECQLNRILYDLGILKTLRYSKWNGGLKSVKKKHMG